MIWLTILAYIAALWVLSYFFKKHADVDEYLMSRRNAGTIQIAAGLFTLIGGGELVTMASLGFVYGRSGIALFVGYAVAFFFLGIVAGKIRSGANEKKYISLPDYVHDNFGKSSGLIVFIFSFLAFFALLMLQLSTAGAVISPFINLSYNQIVFLIGFVVFIYLLVGGFRVVLITDVIQGIAMIVLLPLLAYIVLLSNNPSVNTLPTTESLPVAIWISMIVTGFFVASASADIWQRAYAAKSDSAARNGLMVAGILFLLFGFILVEIGIYAREIGTADPNSAFVETITTGLPVWAAILAVLMVVSAVMSTSDTEMFVLTGMLQHELRQFPFILGKASTILNSVKGARVFIGIVAIFAIGFAMMFSDLVDIYTWLLSAIVVISPIILFSLFWKASPIAMLFSLLANTIVFAVLVSAEILNIDNIYFICIPGITFYMIALLASQKHFHSGEKP
uniref:Na+/proline symporter n=1 Tax=Candidatus Kentrum sp. LFY TaxID=2126342 RepID=A0A450WJ10_9GAMM|nr:MAG: Na+/proline symporter [Candidatus Kentron sp. LFY]